MAVRLDPWHRIVGVGWRTEETEGTEPGSSGGSSGGGSSDVTENTEDPQYYIIVINVQMGTATFGTRFFPARIELTDLYFNTPAGPLSGFEGHPVTIPSSAIVPVDNPTSEMYDELDAWALPVSSGGADTNAAGQTTGYYSVVLVLEKLYNAENTYMDTGEGVTGSFVLEMEADYSAASGTSGSVTYNVGTTMDLHIARSVSPLGRVAEFGRLVTTGEITRRKSGNASRSASFGPGEPVTGPTTYQCQIDFEVRFEPTDVEIDFDFTLSAGFDNESQGYVE